ncbi:MULTISPECIES: HAD family phosphatase [unclassified Streptomyces]|uniref:HAD family hydrolase n=1 Tax=unclassified Streptomyces TaxID=2593676 RepID=UPI000B80D997|nr:HAD family phosphatase [Streptomyces sp. MnatMP-M77]MYT81266.1 HAD-IA family hydrolase [Streptomyces sp. SID8364]
MKRAVVFDLDGTLVDSSHAYFLAEREALARVGYEDFTHADHARFIGKSMKEMWEIFVAERGVSVAPQHLLELSNRIYLQAVRDSVKTYPHVVALSRRLRHAGFELAVASGSSRAVIDAVIASAGLSDLFPVKVSAEDVEHGKPDPAIFREAGRRLSVSPEECTVVEDAAAGVEAALRAGMSCVAVTSQAAVAWPSALSAGHVLLAEHDHFDDAGVFGWIRSRSGRMASRPGTDGLYGYTGLHDH